MEPSRDDTSFASGSAGRAGPAETDVTFTAVQGNYATDGTAALAPQPRGCARCGLPAPFGASFCANCGSPLAVALQTAPGVFNPGSTYATAPGAAPFVGGYDGVGIAPIGAPAMSWQGSAAGMTIVMPTQPGGLLAVPYAGFWLRLTAWVLDLIAQFVLIFIGAIIIEIIAGAPNSSMYNAQYAGRPFLQALILLVPWLYFTVAESSRHQGTFGKRMIGLRVVDEAGRRISFARANGRFWSKQLSTLILGIGYVICAFTKRKQALHDLISGCYVVSIRR